MIRKVFKKYSARGVTAVLLVSALSMQLVWHHQKATARIQRAYLPQPPGLDYMRVMALGEPAVLSRVAMLWLQSFDYQPGISLALKDLNYDRLLAWLSLLQQLDEYSQYPLFAAAYIYANVPDEARQRQVLEFIEQCFQHKPDKYWRWLAHAAILARHRLHDNDLALYYAHLLRTRTHASQVPAWARQMEIGILEEKGEYESARMLIGGLLNESAISDPHEMFYLNERLKQLNPDK